VADPKPQRAALRRWDPAAYAFNQFIFENSQGRDRYRRPNYTCSRRIDCRDVRRAIAMIFGRYLRTAGPNSNFRTGYMKCASR
jgi:hypothetical protein